METDYSNTDRNKVMKIPHMDLKLNFHLIWYRILIFFYIKKYIYFQYIKKYVKTMIPPPPPPPPPPKKEKKQNHREILL